MHVVFFETSKEAGILSAACCCRPSLQVKATPCSACRTPMQMMPSQARQLAGRVVTRVMLSQAQQMAHPMVTQPQQTAMHLPQMVTQ